ncbi:MAG: glycosyltransferase [Candidatus Hydrogenedentes bacterium]|nr:glycosyltransferase [Candidatus Hydrogenedentota bacterium]
MQLGHRVTIACRANSVLVDVASDVGCASLPLFHFARGFRLRQWFCDILAMRSFIAMERPDVIHVNGSQDHWVAGLAKLFFARTACVLRTRHNTYAVKNNFVNRFLNRRLTTYQICVCEMVRATLAVHAAFDGKRMVAIHNGVDAQVYQPQPSKREAARRAFSYHDDDIVCGIAARLVKAKGHSYLFGAFNILKADFPALRLLILGQGVLEDALKKQVDELGLAEIVQFAGFRQNMDSCIQAFDIGVLPSIDCDTSSFSLKEQMAAEIPVVCSDYGGLPEIVTDGEEGLVVPHGTVEPLAEAMRRLLQDASQRRVMGRRGRERVLRDFTGSVFARKTVEAYEKAQELANERSAS